MGNIFSAQQPNFTTDDLKTKPICANNILFSVMGNRDFFYANPLVHDFSFHHCRPLSAFFGKPFLRLHCQIAEGVQPTSSAIWQSFFPASQNSINSSWRFQSLRVLPGAVIERLHLQASFARPDKIEKLSVLLSRAYREGKFRPSEPFHSPKSPSAPQPSP